MPSRNWRIVAALGLTALVAVSTAGIIYRDASNSEAIYSKQTDDAAQAARDSASIHANRACALVPLVERAECQDDEQEAARERERNEYDLQAQLVTSAWTRAMGLAALVGMVVGIIGVGLLWTTFRETRNAAEAARRTHQAFIDVERARVVPALEGAVEGGSGEDESIRFILSVQNIGRTSATLLGVYYDILASPVPTEKCSRFGPINTLLRDGAASPIDKAMRVPVGSFENTGYIGGYIEYLSAFEITHKVYFCYKVSAQSVRPPPHRRRYGTTLIRRTSKWPSDI